MTQKLFDVPSVARIVGASPATVRRDVERLGIVPARVGDRRVFDADEVEKLIAFRQKVEAAREAVACPQ